jgi:hypothetical protein
VSATLTCKEQFRCDDIIGSSSAQQYAKLGMHNAATKACETLAQLTKGPLTPYYTHLLTVQVCPVMVLLCTQ